MKRFQVAACCLFLIGCGVASRAAQAQATVDLAQMTCEQLLAGTPNSVEAVIWLSGYYNGLQKNTVLNLNQFKQNAEVVVAECRASPKTTVMKAVEALLSRK